jgi:hypothetical protein
MTASDGRKGLARASRAAAVRISRASTWREELAMSGGFSRLACPGFNGKAHDKPA